MTSRTLEVPWERLRPGVTVVRPDGEAGRATVVERTPEQVVVIFTDGRREQHQSDEHALVLIHEG